MIKIIISVVICLAFVCVLAACNMRGQVMDGDGMVNSYHQISQDEAKELMEAEARENNIEAEEPAEEEIAEPEPAADAETEVESEPEPEAAAEE